MLLPMHTVGLRPTMRLEGSEWSTRRWTGFRGWGLDALQRADDLRTPARFSLSNLGKRLVLDI
jgi:hypothetical protein